MHNFCMNCKIEKGPAAAKQFLFFGGGGGGEDGPISMNFPVVHEIVQSIKLFLYHYIYIFLLDIFNTSF